MPAPQRFSAGALFLWCLGALVVAGADPRPLPLTGPPPYLTTLIAEADRARLASSPGWLALGLYHRTLLGGEASETSDPTLFLAPDGATDPEAELRATLAAFFSDSRYGKDHERAQCRYIARYYWLNRRLNFDPRRLPVVTCRHFDQWMKALSPKSVDVVFPAADVNDPSSMFGHLFLRINSANEKAQNALLSYSVSYAADVRAQDIGIVFAYRGLFGGYPGTFTMSPYYTKQNEYETVDNRDLWVYPLHLTDAQIRMLLREVWELGPVQFPYYFFSDNCASQDLDLLDGVQPSFQLMNPFHGWVIPSDTVRVLGRAGLLGPGRYHPSLRTQLKNELAALPPAERDMVKPMTQGQTPSALATLPPTEQARVLDAAYDDLHYHFLHSHDRDPAIVDRQRVLLLARSKLPDPPPGPPPVAPPDPQTGHESERLLLSVGVRRHEGYQELAWRPAYHDLLDPQAGYTPGAEINFLDVHVRHQSGRDSLELQRLTLVQIVSLATRDRFFHPWSWQIETGLVRRQVTPTTNPLLYDVVGGAGVTYGHLGRAVVYGFMDGAAETGPSLAAHYAVGAGPEIGVLAWPDRRWTLRAYARDLRFGGGSPHSEAVAGLKQRIDFGQNHALSLTIAHRREFGTSWNDYEASWSIFFF